MNEGIQPAPLAVIGPCFAGYLGLDWTRDRSRVLKLINEFRDQLHIDPEMPNIYSHKAFCIKPSCWPVHCLNSCTCAGDTFQGFTLPEELENILEAWIDTEPVDSLHSKWWEGRVCRITTNTPSHTTKIIRTGDYSVTQRALRKPTFLHFYSDGNDGTEIHLRVRDIDNDIINYTITICAGQVVTSEEPVYAIESLSIINHKNDANIKMYDDDNYELSSYTGRTITPRYPVYKVLAPCKESVLIQGSQRYVPLCYDDEIMEIGSLTILKEAGKMIRYGNEGTDVSEINISDRYERRLKRMIRGAIKQQTGSNMMDGNLITNDPFLDMSSHKLKGY